MHKVPTYLPCPWCGKRLNHASMANHLRDTGAITVRPVDSCLVLFDLRNSDKDVPGA